jgi:membrane-associated phospholipid phosphatase
MRVTGIPTTSEVSFPSRHTDARVSVSLLPRYLPRHKLPLGMRPPVAVLMTTPEPLLNLIVVIRVYTVARIREMLSFQEVEKKLIQRH